MNLQNKNVIVVGLGKTAIALVKLLQRENALPFVSEYESADRKQSFCDELTALGVPYECGGHTLATFLDADLIIPSPGVSPEIPPIAQAVAQGVPVMGEMECASHFCRSRVLAVTGTNGKTTTTELLRTLVEACGHSVVLTGNNDYPFSAAVMLDPAPDYIVLEVSSYQLETAAAFRPWLATVLNVTPDHLARHKTMEGYAAVKANIFQRQTAQDAAIINADDPYTSAMPIPDGTPIWTYSLESRLGGMVSNARIVHSLWLDGDLIREDDTVIATVQDTRLPGRHNLQNVLASLAMMRAGGFNWDGVLGGLRKFQGVEHRIEYILQHAGVDYYNDSKSTNIDSLKVALESFQAPIVLIAGGRGKGADYRVLRELVQQHVKVLITLGEDAQKLEDSFGDLVPTERAATLMEATERAKLLASPGDCVLLSPACASFDMFNSFEHRGVVFKECVRQVTGQSD